MRTLVVYQEGVNCRSYRATMRTGSVVGQAFGHDEQKLRHNKDQEPEVFFSAIVGLRRKHRYAQNPKRFRLVFGEW